MPAQVTQADLDVIAEIIEQSAEGLTAHKVKLRLSENLSYRTVVRRLNALASAGRIAVVGKGRATKYKTVARASAKDRFGQDSDSREHRKEVETEFRESSMVTDLSLALSPEGAEIAALVRRPLTKRPPEGYRREFLDTYLPNRTYYLTEEIRKYLMGIGTPSNDIEPAGTYARRILDHLLIDLSFHSSRLEGNTYSLLETKKLIAWGKQTVGRDAQESQMILNHKAAIEFLVESARELEIDRRTLLNIHALLAENLLGDPAAGGRLRTTPVVIGGSPYIPNDIPQMIEECFNQIAIVSSHIDDPFEQSFFLLVHLPYLQPFEDVNKRVSRLSANIPLIRGNLRPLSFIDVPTGDYVAGVLGVYELNRVELLRDVFVWAYERSAERYSAIRDTIGEPDEFRLEFRIEIKEVVAEIIVGKISVSRVATFVKEWGRRKIPDDKLPRFIAVIEAELIGLHEGNYARYRVTPSQLEAWIELD